MVSWKWQRKNPVLQSGFDVKLWRETFMIINFVAAKFIMQLLFIKLLETSGNSLSNAQIPLKFIHGPKLERRNLHFH